MKSKRTGLLKRIQWHLECGAFLALERLLALVPLPSLWNFGATLAGAARLLPSRLTTVRNNLRTALGPDASAEEVETATREVFRHTIANLLCSFRAAQMSPDALGEIAVFKNGEILARAQARSKGVVVILCHMGNWELLAQVAFQPCPGAPFSTMYRPLNNPHFDRIIADRRRKRGMTLFAKQDALKGPTAFLRKGGIVGIVADQRAGRAGTRCPFFGRLMSVTPLPALLQRRTGCEVVGISVRTTRPGRWTIKYHELPSGRPDRFTPAHMTELLETMYRESLVDVFWFQDLWRLNKHYPLVLRAKRGPLRLAAQRDQPLAPFPVLVRVPDNPADFAQALPALRALADSRPDLALHLLARDKLRSTAASSDLPHTFHAIEDDALPSGLPFALVATLHERAARELARLFSGPVYSLPEVAPQSSRLWHPVAIDRSLSPADQWLAFFRNLGMHEPPLRFEYV